MKWRLNWRHTLRARLMLGAAAMLIVFLAGAGWAVQRAHEESVRAAHFARLQTTVYGLLAAAEVDPDGTLVMPAALPDPRLSLPDSGLYASIFNVARHETWRSASTVGLELPPPRQVGTGQWRYEMARAAGRDYLAVGTGVSWAGKAASVPLVLSVFEDKVAFDREIAVFEHTAWAWLGGAALLLLLSQTVLLRWGLAPLREATREIRAIEHGEQTTVGGRYPVEVAALTDNLNTLITQERLR
ncbi:MAG: histidine kinase, partial [Burkholderiales bacterium]|nr:histidine kinase [Burkholderiales bacterium]